MFRNRPRRNRIEPTLEASPEALMGEDDPGQLDAGGGRGLAPGRLARLIAHAWRLHRRLPWLLPTLSFAVGWLSFFLFQRGENLSRAIAAMALVGWPWLLAENLLGRWLVTRSNGRLSIGAVRFVTQQIQQEILFFSLPFLFASMVWAPGPVVFMAVASLVALMVTIDPLYMRLIANHGGWSTALHAYCTFTAALVVLPVALHLPLDEALPIAVIIVAVTLLAGLPRMLMSVQRWPLRLLGTLALVASLWLALWLRAWIPPAGLWVREARIAPWIHELRPGPALREIPVADLHEGLVAFVAVRAPSGLSQQVVFEWRHQGELVDAIPARIAGGREAGFRTYSRKQNFPVESRGRWTVDLRTPAGQLVARLRFQVI